MTEHSLKTTGFQITHQLRETELFLQTFYFQGTTFFPLEKTWSIAKYLMSPTDE